MRKTPLMLAVIIILLLAGCTKTDSFKSRDANNQVRQANDLESKVTMRSGGKTYKVIRYKAEYLTDVKSGKMGQTVYFKDVGNKRLPEDFVPADPRRGGRTNVTYALDNELTSDHGLTSAQVISAMNNALETWDEVKCSDLNMTRIPFSGDLGWVQALVGMGGSFAWVADIQHSGFLPPAFFDLFAPGGSAFILGITFSFVFVDENGNFTDIDHNGLIDKAFSETYYNDGFEWSTNSNDGFDIETVVLHESGHGLSQNHFGKAFRTNSNGKLHFAPRSVMNAAYSGEQRSLRGTDNGGHCSIWANWPKK